MAWWAAFAEDTRPDAVFGSLLAGLRTCQYAPKRLAVNYVEPFGCGSLSLHRSSFRFLSGKFQAILAKRLCRGWFESNSEFS